MIEKLKTNPVSMKVHPDFRDGSIMGIIEERIKKGIERASKPVTCCQVTKAIDNLFKANPKLKQMLIEVRMNGK